MTAERVCPETNDTYTGEQCPHCGGVHSTPTHTPGPWKAQDLTAGRNEEGGFSVFSLSDAEKRPATAFGDTTEQAKANAELIAAAPELLEALYSALNVEGIGPEQAEKIGLDYAWHFAKVRAAIAKAEGR